MNKRRLFIVAKFMLYIQWKKTIKNITSWHKTLLAWVVKANKFQDAAQIFHMNSTAKFFD